MQNYSLSEFIKNIYSVFLTKLTWSSARLIRRPCYIRGKSSIEGGKGLTTGYSCRFDLPGKKKTLYIGEQCEFGDNTHIVAYNNVVIGNNVLIASRCFISDTNHGEYSGGEQSSPYQVPNQRKLVSTQVKIGDNVWIGENAVVLAGSNIGNGCIIGANTTVSRDIPDNCVVVGCNRIIKQYNNETKIWEKITVAK